LVKVIPRITISLEPLTGVVQYFLYLEVEYRIIGLPQFLTISGWKS